MYSMSSQPPLCTRRKVGQQWGVTSSSWLKKQEEDQDAEVAELITAGENKVKSIDVPEEVVDLEEFSQRTARFLFILDCLWQEFQSPPYTQQPQGCCCCCCFKRKSLSAIPFELFCSTDESAVYHECAGLPGEPWTDMQAVNVLTDEVFQVSGPLQSQESHMRQAGPRILESDLKMRRLPLFF